MNMKSALIFLTFLGLAFGGTVPTRNLQDDLNDFVALIPIDQILSIALDYLANDAQVQEAFDYLQSDEFHNILTTLEGLPEFKNFISFLRVHGLEPSDFLNTFHSLVGLGPYIDTGARSTRRGVGVNGLINDIIAVLPIDQLQALFQEKLTTSPDFKALYDAIRGPEFQSILANLRALREYQNLLARLGDYGVDTDHYIVLARDLFGVPSNIPPTRNLQDDLNDFLALIPIDQILSIALDYLANDAQVQEAMAYLQSDEFHNILTTLEGLTEFKNFISFLRVHGLEPSDFLNTFHALVGLGPYIDTGAKSTRRGVGVNGLINDIIAVLPIDQLQALFQEKLTTSPDFKALYDAIRGPEFQTILATLRELPEYIQFLDRLRDYGVDTDHYIVLARDLFGVPTNIPPTRNLQDDLNDFLALIPIDQILSIALDYLANDAQVQEAMAYLQSDEFHNILTTLEGLTEFKNFISFLRVHGLEPSDFLNTFHTLVGLGPYIDTGARSTRRGVGVNGLINDIIAVLPIDQLQALFQEKLTTSPDFKALYDAIRGPEFQTIAATVRELPEYIKLLDKLRDLGVDIDHYIQVIRGLFNIA